MRDQIEKLDRFIITQKSLLEKGVVLHVKVDDGFILMKNEVDEETGEQKTATYFSEFDGSINISMNEIRNYLVMQK